MISNMGTETIFLNPASGLTHECAKNGHCCACRGWFALHLSNIRTVVCTIKSANVLRTGTGLDSDITGVKAALLLLRHGTEYRHHGGVSLQEHRAWPVDSNREEVQSQRESCAARAKTALPFQCICLEQWLQIS